MHMFLNRIQLFDYSLNKGAQNNHRYIKLKASLLLSFLMLSGVSATAAPDKHYLDIEHSISTDKNDLEITSVGMLSLQGNMAGYAKLSYLASDINGNGSTLDLGGGYSFNNDVSLYFLLGVSLGYNWDNDDYIAAYFPEVGIVMDITRTFGITVSGKRYFNLYEEDEDVVMLGLVFRS
jgi:hypothetical protein